MRVPTWQLRQLVRADEGQALVLTAMALVVLMVMAGLGVDVAFLRYQKQQMQKAADAGAIGGASALIYSGNYTAAARNDAAANGFTHGTNGITVTVNKPPQTAGDPYQGNSNYVEVIVSQPQPTFFMRIGGFNSVAVSARAVGSAIGSASGCMYVLDPTDNNSLWVEGSGNVTSACGIYVGSSDPSALKKSGSGNLSATFIGIVGGMNEVGSGSVTPTPVTGIASVSDPLSGTPKPTVGACTQTGQVVISGTTATLNQGVYCGGIKVTGASTVTFNSGLYILLGGLYITGSGTFVGNGVTFYNTGNTTYPYAPINIAGSTSMSLSAPVSGSLAGILFFEDSSVGTCCGSTTSNTINGSGGAGYTGALYFPNTPLTYTGSSTLSAYTVIVAWTVKITGSTTINDNYSSLPGGASPIHAATLAE